MKVAILGAGASGLLAAQALTDLNIHHDIYDRSVPTTSNIRGLHYLHDNCGLPLDYITVHNYVLGNNRGELPYKQYSRKLGTPENNSLVDLPAFSVGYDFRAAYNLLVERHVRKVVEMSITRHDVFHTLDHYDYIISTIPLHIIFPEAKCEKVERRAMKGRPDGVEQLVGLNDNQVIYNIDESVNWYRYSNVLGNEWTEVVSGGDFTIPKLVDTDFESPYDHIILQGRYGKWRRKFLAHHAYYETKEMFK